MKLITFLKAAVTIMTVLIVAGFVLVLYKVADNYRQRKLKTMRENQEMSFVKSDDEVLARSQSPRVAHAFACGADSCMVVREELCDWLVRVDAFGKETMRYRITNFVTE